MHRFIKDLIGYGQPFLNQSGATLKKGAALTQSDAIVLALSSLPAMYWIVTIIGLDRAKEKLQ